MKSCASGFTRLAAQRPLSAVRGCTFDWSGLALKRSLLDLVSDAAANGQTILVLTVVDDCTRKCLAGRCEHATAMDCG